MDSRISIDKIQYDLNDGAVETIKLPKLLNLFTELIQTHKIINLLSFFYLVCHNMLLLMMKKIDLLWDQVKWKINDEMPLKLKAPK